MKEKRLVIHHPDRKYMFRFCDYLQRKVRCPLQVRSFADREELILSVRDNPPDILLVPEGFREDAALQGRSATYYFSETAQPEDPQSFYIYRPMEKNVRQLLRGIEDQPGTSEKQKRAARVFGVYSPVGASGQTAAALLIGQQLAEKDNTLYLNLERFSGLDRLLGGEKEGTLSDLLYYSRVQGDPSARLPEVTEHLGNLSYVRPAAVREDLRAAGEADWNALIGGIRDSGVYRYLILDIGDGPEREDWLLALCDRIFMPVRADRVSGAKEAEWRQCEEEAGGEELLGRVKRFVLPPLEEKEFTDYRRLRFSAWGQYLRQLLLEEDL